MNDDILTEPFLLDEEENLGMCLVVSESLPIRDLDSLLEDLHTAFGSGFVWTLKEIAAHNEFKPLTDETGIYTVGGKNSEDYKSLLNAARKAVEHGYRVFILPNPKGTRTADFIFERKGVYKMYDLKTITGKASVSNRLLDSIGQTNHVLLNMTSDYNARLLASDIKGYFETNSKAIEVLIFKGNKVISVKRGLVENKAFNRLFRKLYEK
jgi:hypothetical protein